MQKRLRIVRDGVPHYVAPWFSELSPAARKLAYSGPSRNDPAGQLGLPIPDPDSMAQSVLDFGPSQPCKTKPVPAKSKPIPDAAADLLLALGLAHAALRVVSLNETVHPNQREAALDAALAALAVIRRHDGSKA